MTEEELAKAIAAAAPPKGPSNLPYLVAVVAMSFLGLVAIVAVLVLRPNADNASLYVAIGGVVGPTTAALLAFLKSQETHLVVNSRMDEFKRLLAIDKSAKEDLAYERGRLEERKERV